jgi:hypothetical protein
MPNCTPRGLGQDPIQDCSNPATTKVSIDRGGGAKIIWDVCDDHLNEIYHKLQQLKKDFPIVGDRTIKRFSVIEYYGE